jgi:pimeloyl-ACP methyl ester carboxylesterase
MTLPDPARVIRAEGPWEHRDIAANGARFHVAVMGEGPLVLLLHGFPLYWWTWRHQLEALAAAGYRVAAMDLRGYGGSDHTPRGYDPVTLSSDVAGVIRVLGANAAVVVGQGWGGQLAWSLGVLVPSVVTGIVPIAAPHPRRSREAALKLGSPQQRVSGYRLGMAMPWRPERELVADEAAMVGRLLREWSYDTDWITPEVEDNYRAAMMVLNTPYCAAEYHRWAARSLVRPDGWRFHRIMSEPVKVPVLQVQGAEDKVILASTIAGSQAYASEQYELAVMQGVGHFPQEERPDELSQLLIDWLPTAAQG